MSHKVITSETNTGLDSERWRLIGNQIKEILNRPYQNNDVNKAVVESNIRNLLNSVSGSVFIDIGFYTYLDKFTIAPKNDSTFAVMCKMGLY